VKSINLLTAAFLFFLASLIPLANTLAADSNLIANSSVETANSSGTLPVSWNQNKWGTNTASFTYMNGDAYAGSRSLHINMTQRSSGDAKWMFAHIPVKPSQKYTYTEFYKSSVATEVDIEYLNTSNKYTYKWLNTTVVSANWKQYKKTFTTPANAKSLSVFHVINKVGWLQTDEFSLVEGDGTTPPPTPTPPTVQITSPANGATVSGTQAVTATATDAQAVASVQFKLDGANLGAPDTSAPYSVNWDTNLSLNGNHTLGAVATNTANLTATAPDVTVTVNNVITPPPPPPPAATNLIPNPSFETDNGGSPANWLASNWGNNTSAFTYLNTGHTGTRSVKAEITSYTNGAANWYYSPIPVTAGKTYKYENWYQSNVDTEVDAEVIMNDGSVQYYWITTVLASAGWNKVSANFVIPTGAKSVTIYHILAKKGYLVTDDYNLAEYIPARFNRALISLTFDDGWRSIYTNGLPLLNKYGFVSTQYLLTETIDYPDYMTIAMMNAFKDQGSEIASHTISHRDLTTLNNTQLNLELSQSQTNLRAWTGTPVDNFATPYGAYNSTVINAVKQYYRSHRSVEEGYNTKDSFNIYNIKVQNILYTTTPSQVQAWVNQAMADNSWLVLVYHEVGTNNEDPTYSVTPANLDAQLNVIKQSGIMVVTVGQALDEISAQL
jgi:peptidoglycan/xylan/chitin deacetylase (PgdA/CDA1 family)